MTSDEEKEYIKLDFIGIGAPKCATTWIYECLREHPEIYILSFKTEPQATYFLDPVYQKGLENYTSFFRLARPNQVKGEFTDFYLEKKDVVVRMKKHNPKIKLIVCLRNPIQRAWSQYLHRIYVTKMRWNSFEEAIEKDFQVIVERGFYYNQLREYYARFPRMNIMTLITDDIQSDPLTFVQEIYKFLNVDSSFNSHTAYRKISPTKFKITKLGQTVYKITPRLKRNRLGWKIQQSKFLKTCFYRFADFYASKKDSIPPMKEETSHYLKELYREDIQNLEKLINRDLSHWR